jgi:hypothetical protein
MAVIGANVANRCRAGKDGSALGFLHPLSPSSVAVGPTGIVSAHYNSNPGIRYVEVSIHRVATALVRHRADRRRAIQDLEECSRDVAAGLIETIEHR